MTVQTTCWKCACVFHLPNELHAAARRSENISFWCPYGHSAHFPAGATEEDKLRRERDRLKQNEARLIEEAREARAIAEKAERATKRLKKRAAAGSCPCCQRSFGNMAAHMRHQHPDWVKEQQTAKVVPIRAA